VPRLGHWPILPLALMVAACGQSPQPTTTPLDELAAKPAEVRAKLDQAQRDQAEALKRAAAEATGAEPDAEPRR